MSDVLARIAMALAAALVAIGLAVEYHAFDALTAAAKRANAPHLTQREADKTLDDLHRVSQLRPGTQALLTAAGLEFKLHRYAAAEQQAAHATRREPSNFSTWLTLGVIRKTRGEAAAATAAFDRAHLLNPRYPIPR
jgi:cytochrome c-type biogenesis protein CcmH/NrfG